MHGSMTVSCMSVGRLAQRQSNESCNECVHGAYSTELRAELAKSVLAPRA